MKLNKELRKILQEEKTLWTEWKVLDNGKMRRVENKNAKWLLAYALKKAFLAGREYTLNRLKK